MVIYRGRPVDPTDRVRAVRIPLLDIQATRRARARNRRLAAMVPAEPVPCPACGAPVVISAIMLSTASLLNGCVPGVQYTRKEHWYNIRRASCDAQHPPELLQLSLALH